MSERTDAVSEARPQAVPARMRRCRPFAVTVPRFGFLSLFTVMLLFVSVAGWMKFHDDLYREEETLLADLAKANCHVIVERFGDVSRSIPPREPPWYRLPEAFRRVRSLDISYPRLDLRPLVERAAMLPSVENLDFRYMREPRTVGPAAPLGEAASRFEGLDVELPQFDDGAIPDLDQPLPAGEALSHDEIAETVEAWRAAWLTPGRLPRTGIVRCDSMGARHPQNREAIDMRGPDGCLRAVGKDLSLANRTKISGVRQEIEGLREIHRVLDRTRVERYVDDPENRWLESSAGRKELETASLLTGGPIRLYAREKDRDLSAIESIERTDDGLLRIDFRPTTKSYPAEGIEDETQLSAVFRPNRDFAVESYDLRVERTDAASPDPIVWTSRFRGVSSDHSDAYLLDAYAIDALRAGARNASAPSYYLQTCWARYAYDFERKLPAELFEPATYGAIELPVPRPLPVWRWYRVTFLLGCGMAVAALGRRIRSRRADHGRRLRDTSEANGAESDR